MEPKFWHEKWAKNEIAFHQGDTHPLLVRHFDDLQLSVGERIFIPLCGKTRDIYWFLSNCYRVAGAELSTLAVDQLFAELKIEPTISSVGELTHYGAEGIDIFNGDIFKLTKDLLGVVDAIYDRAALIALPDDLRAEYAEHLMTITNNAPQLLICCEYDESRMSGPPFSVSKDKVERYYSDKYKLLFKEQTPIVGGLKGNLEAFETVWMLGKH